MEFLDNYVSIIMPAYNAEKYISESIDYVKNQLFTNWELIIIDDYSKDKTLDVIRSFDDSRIKIIELEKNSGAAYARNRGIEVAQGEFIAFLDSDDLWTEEKLKQQISFMKSNDYAFTCTEYTEMNQDSKIIDIVKVQDKLDYGGVLKYCPGNSTIVYNAKKLGKFYAPLIKRRNDFALWLQIIKKVKYIYGLHESHTIYRVRDNSLSSNKIKLLKYQWKVLRDLEKLPILYSMYLLMHKVFQVLLK